MTQDSNQQPPKPSYPAFKLRLGQELLDLCSNKVSSTKLAEMLDLPQVDGALYGLYYGHTLEGYIKCNDSGDSVSMHPTILQSIMRASCAVGFYTQESIARADSLWDKGTDKPVKYHYCFSCKANSVTNIQERICDTCKNKEIEEEELC